MDDRWVFRLAAALLGAALLVIPKLAYPQGATVYQNGDVIPGHLAKWFTTGRIGDAGGLQGDGTGDGLAPLGINDKNGLGLCSNSGLTTGPYNALCLGHDADSNGLITLDSYNGLPNKGIGIRLNGVTYSFPGSGNGNVVGPTAPPPVAGHQVIWNGGTTVKDGGPQLPNRMASVTCDGTTDVTTALQADLDAYSGQGGGIYQMPVGKGCVVGGPADLKLPFNVQLTCTMNGGGGWPAGDYATFADLLVDKAHTITTVNLNQYGRSGVFGCAIVRKGYTKVATLRQSLSTNVTVPPDPSNFAGTGLKCEGTSDVTFQDNLIIGFQTAISAACSRFNARRNRIDSTNGIVGVLCYDTCYIEENEVWPFSISPTGILEYQDSSITGITNSAGSYQITLGSAPATALVNGDRIIVHGVTGTDAPGDYGANGRWPITVVSPTQFVLQGSTYRAGYGAGTGKAFLSAFSRPGVGIEFGQGQFFGHNNMVFGWDYGVRFTNANEGSYCHNCWIDNFASKDPVPIGVYSTGTSNNAEYSGYVNAPVRQIYMDGSSPGQFLRVHNGYIGGVGGFTNGPAVIGVGTGNLQLVGGAVVGTPANVPYIYISDSAGAVALTGVAIGSGTALFQTPATGCPKLKIDGVTGPCAFTPSWSGAGTGATTGTFTYTRQTGQYTQSKAGVDVNIELEWSARPVAPAGTDTSINGLPVLSGAYASGCALGFTAGLSVSSGRITVAAGVPRGGANFIVMSQSDPTGVSGSYPPSLLGTSGAVQATCHYLP